MIGSHIDTVATAGAFDGPLGVLGALEVIRTLNDGGIETERPIEAVCFTEEEGSRFGTDMLGSAVAAGRISLDDAYSLVDSQGNSLGDELTRTGFAGPERELLEPPFAYVECHIEQGPVLANAGADIGVVTGVQGISWQALAVHGRAAHAGATPTELRLDAGVAASAVVTRLCEMVSSNRYGDLRATVGRIAVEPNLVNVVPAKAELTVDMRNPDDDLMIRAEHDLSEFLTELVARQPGLEIHSRRMAKTTYVPFDVTVRRIIASVADEQGLTHAELLSGAGHDAQEMASICPTAMVFIPGEYGGISHSPREYSSPEACERGISVLAGVVLRLAAMCPSSIGQP
jgi:N-carbamoyl-L-amino-acid hydrolase